jgi:CBS domain-containing protein
MAAVRDVMSTEIVAVEPDATLAEAATVMGGRHVGSALVLDGGRPVGIFTERDLLRALASDFGAAGDLVQRWMTPDPLGVEASIDVRDALRLMLERGFRHLTVMQDGALVGIVSLRDLSASEGEPPATG